MARTGTRGWKGCAMCKFWKDRAQGDPVRLDTHQIRSGNGAAVRRFTRHSIPAEQVERPLLPSGFEDPSDCRHGCNGLCLVSGSERCNFTCHPDLSTGDFLAA